MAVKMGCPKGKYCKLKCVEESEIIKEITDKTPEECGLWGYLWDRKGVSELVKQKFGIEMPVRTMGHYLSSVTSTGGLRYAFCRGKFNQDVYMGFLTRLINTTDRKVFAIADNSSTHHGSLVKEWLEKQTESITVFHLPPYAPHLNPVEYLNNNLKRDMLNQGYSVDADEVEKKARYIMRSFLTKKARVSSFFDNDFVIYAKN